MGLRIRNILLDRDGTIIQDRHYLKDPEQVELIPGSAQALMRLSNQGCRLFVVTNQSGIGRGLLTWNDARAVQQRLEQLLAGYGVRLTRNLMCPHLPADKCSCRKPAPGMWKTLQAEYGLDPGQSIVIGDKVSDMLFGSNSGLKASILVLTGHGQAEASSLGLDTDFKSQYQVRPSPGASLPLVLARDVSAAQAWIARMNVSSTTSGSTRMKG
jgi:D-glycero-D-manno-heptose 1,7-bisphosphate phosphatase